jgi:hypothetical protein
MADNVIRGYFSKLSDEASPQTRPTAELGGKLYGHLRRLPNFVRDPSMGAIDRLLAEHPEVLGIEDESGSVLLFDPEEADYAAAAAAMGIPDLASPDFLGIKFVIRSTDDWFNRPDSPARERSIKRSQLRLRLKRLKREREELLAQGKLRPERLL